jgi:hypothetical protein
VLATLSHTQQPTRPACPSASAAPEILQEIYSANSNKGNAYLSEDSQRIGPAAVIENRSKGGTSRDAAFPGFSGCVVAIAYTRGMQKQERREKKTAEEWMERSMRF